jgi:hypothetical protein
MAKTTTRDRSLQDLVRQLEDTAKQAGDRISDYLSEARVRQRLSDAADAINDVRLAVLRRVQGEQAGSSRKAKPADAETPLEEMTVRELHALASERQIPRRSSMGKAELIDALRET